MKDFGKIFLKPKEETEIKQGFPWVFDNEIFSVKYEKSSAIKYSECTIKDGSAVEVFSKDGAFLGSGILNKKSKIAVRIISEKHCDEIFSDLNGFWEKRILDSYNIRRLLFSENDSYRLVFAEADLIPGFICERYVDENNKVILVTQFLSLSCEIFKEHIYSALKKIVKPDYIYEKSDESVREKEGLPMVSTWIGKSYTDVITIIENGIKINVDIVNGQKTGYFLDQKENRFEIRKFCHGKKVLDTFTHTGAFSLNAFKAGAKKVIAVDISEDACNLVKKNIKLNGAENVVQVVCEDVFLLLKEYESSGEKFDVVILDPPAFTKSAKSIEKAYGGYKEINLRAMRILNEGGILITCSCSHFFDSKIFYEMLVHAAKDSHKKVQILQKRGAAPDHPCLLGYPKSEYLKCAVCRVF